VQLERSQRLNVDFPCGTERRDLNFIPRHFAAPVERPAHPVAERYFQEGRRICLNGQWPDDIEQNLFGRKLTKKEFYHLCGVSSDAILDLYPHWTGGICWKAKGYPIVQQCGSVARADNGDLVIGRDWFEIAAEQQQKGHAACSVAVQVAMGRQLGADRIIMVAQGDINRANKRGYFVYPKLGFEGNLTDLEMEQLPATFRGARSVQDIFAFGKEGEEYWLQNGNTRVMTFSLREGSPSLAVLRDYLKRKNIAIPL
jgi:hypothetical protein